MKIERVETLSCDAGWRNYNFLKVTADDGTVGWSEYDEAFGPPGLTDVIQRLAPRLIGLPAREHEKVYTAMASPLRPAPHGLSASALGAFENALLDLKAKSLGIPCHELLGGKQRSEVPIYWSHCATWRISHPHLYSPAITDLNGVKAAGEEARSRGFSAVKTNLFIHGDGKVRQWMPGFGAGDPGLTSDTHLLRSVRAHLEALREGAGPDVEVLVDLNFNGRTEGFMKLIRALEKDFPLFWIELDSYNPDALAYIRRQSNSPIAALETLFGVRQYLPYFQAQAVDVAIIDAVWNGVWQSMKIANVAEAFEVNIAPHNFYSHLATMMNVHFAAAVPNLRVMEHDVDRLAWDDELFTTAPQIRNSAIAVPDTPGWGCDPIEAALLAHPAKKITRYLRTLTTVGGKTIMQHGSTLPKKNAIVIAAEAFMALGLVVMFVLVLGNVVLRYGFNSGIAASEDIARFLFIWITFTGAALGVRENAHLGMDSVVKMLPRKGKLVFAVISHVLMLATTGFLLVGSWQQMELNAGTTALGAVPYPLSWVYAAGVYGSLAIGFLVAANLKRILSGRLTDDELVMVRDAEGLQEAEQIAAQAAAAEERAPHPLKDP